MTDTKQFGLPIGGDLKAFDVSEFFPETLFEIPPETMVEIEKIEANAQMAFVRVSKLYFL